MRELLMELVKRAHAENSVAVATLADGIAMLAYPMDDGMLVGLGMEGEYARRVDATRLLHKRAGDMARFGGWLPAQLKDGAWYVLKRLPSYHQDARLLEEDEVAAAVELLK
ncbi:hypothetical protein [Pseudoduganella namucuonensis]|uniref:Uncharacterized protein n=1 Tax=Pseudoduganella namucuonensis TaxID=1035707 RepID=A0A1I7LW17_9BURK|nr:hypothetical protein [Pseudoduganella namucuonensis]SFV13896.1 hypothetical protein SAMN05216552_104036 [Pseudoduganella namucuonensis]